MAAAFRLGQGRTDPLHTARRRRSQRGLRHGAGETARRRLLAEEVSSADFAPAQWLDWVDPHNHWEIGWFASAEDLCRAMAALDAMARRPGLEPIRDLLALPEPFLSYQVDLSVWPYIDNKGVSVPGAGSFAWLLERDDGKRFAMAATHNDPRRAVDWFTPYVAYAGALGLLARERRGRTDRAPDGSAARRTTAGDLRRGPFPPPAAPLARVP